ncbi:unnamed protein product [Fraxinus pennsylvanica]|uniref:TF-B3 domain-containing protein n=1 Tax=Fraxinus pennsylvanica TaxID=56036 RepID=A0AAD2A998_9LAMI|nr:unnamed protein product [Fraxinus pennsylvanica]
MQTIVGGSQSQEAKDVHGKTWKFRHIYRGTLRRHLLTTGWSIFVNQKKLVAEDSIVFLRAENGDLCIRIRRAKRSVGFGGHKTQSGWNSNGAGNFWGFSGYMRDISPAPKPPKAWKTKSGSPNFSSMN